MTTREKSEDHFRIRCHKETIAFAVVIALIALFLSASGSAEQVNLSEVALLNITQSSFKLSDGQADYFVHIKNEGQVLLKDVQVIDSLPSGMVYIEPEGSSDLPLLKGIENYVDRTTKTLTWYLENMDTSQERWLNFTVQLLDPAANPSLHEVRAEGWAFGYLIKGRPFLPAVPYFSIAANSEEDKACNALPLLPAAIVLAPIEENASMIINEVGLQNESNLQIDA